MQHPMKIGRASLGTGQYVMALFLAGMIVFASAASAADYESPKKMTLEETLPDVPPKGDLYEFSPEVLNDGVMNSYRIYTQNGWFQVHSNEMARVRVHEAAVIHQLEQVRKSDMYVQSMKAAAESTYESMKTLITQPVTTVSGIPSGTKRFFGNLSGQMKELLPGAIRSGDARSLHQAAKDACLLYQDIYRLIHQMVVTYQHTPHRELGGLTPHQKWLEGMQFGPLLVPPLTPSTTSAT